MATTSITGLPQTLTIDAATVVPADYNTGTYKVTMTTLGSFITTNATTVVATGNITGGNLIASGVLISTSTISAAGNITGGNVITAGVLLSSNQISTAGNVTGNNISASNHIGTTVSVSGNVTGGNLLTTGLISASANIVAGNINAGNIANAPSLIGGLISITGNITANGSITVNSNTHDVAIVNGAANAQGNIGSSTKYFNTLFAVAATALYADLAEVYEADADYAPGTVMSFGGSKEVSISTRYADPAVAGVISANPSYLMNNGLTADHRAVVSLTGRVPTSVTGTVYKGSMMISAGNGRAMACSTPAMGTVIGKALENFDGESGIIEIVVGRM
jgi:hypothetical protein